MQKTALKIVKTLRSAGHEAYFAGGCVRDLLLEKDPKDMDIATNARPEQIEDLFENTYAIGKSFGVITVREDGHHFEIATFRSDSSYADGRRPDAILFTHAADDAQRRDFTVNGLFYDPIKDEILDFVGGRNDLQNKIIRFIGDPEKRINEDHLRILRAHRFKSTLDFGFHPDTYSAIKKHADLAGRVSMERVRDELNKILMCADPAKAFEDLQDTGVLKYVLPELEECKGVPQPPQYHMEGDVWTHLMLALESLPKDTSIFARWAVLIHDIGKPQTFKIADRIRFDGHSEVSAQIGEKIMRRLRFGRVGIEHVSWAVKHHFMMTQLLEMPLGRKRHWFLDPRFPTLLTLFYADAAGTLPIDLSLYEAVKKEYEECLRDFAERPKPFLSGSDVMKIRGIGPGPEIGKILEIAWHKQLGGEFKNREEALIFLTSS